MQYDLMKRKPEPAGLYIHSFWAQENHRLFHKVRQYERQYLPHFTPACIEYPYQQFVLCRIIILRLGNRNAVIWMIGHAHAKTVCLNPMVACSLFSRGKSIDTGKDATLRIAGYLVRQLLQFNLIVQLQRQL